MSMVSFKIPVTLAELNLGITLQCGQSFRWFKIPSNNGWKGVLGRELWTLRQDGQFLYCEVTPSKGKGEIQTDYETLIWKYFRLDISLRDLYNRWSSADPKFREIAHKFEGVRILDQDPVENVFSFICSSNNNIQRITKLVDSLCRTFGSLVASVDGEDWFSFPEVRSLCASSTTRKLSSLGFGYRAKYIASSAQMIVQKGGVGWLQDLKSLPYADCRASLMELHGVGPKVADCICLMSMGHLDAIPVDTHVFQIAARDYLPHLKTCKSLTAKMYAEIGDHFRGLYGHEAGWAHSVLFSADLRKFNSIKEAKQNSSQKEAKQNSSQKEAKQNSSQKEAKQNSSQKEAKQNSSQKEAKQNSSQKEAKQNSSQKEAKQNSSQKEAKQNSSQKEAKQNSSQKEAKQNSSQKEAKQNSSQKEAKQNSSQKEVRQNGSQKRKRRE